MGMLLRVPHGFVRRHLSTIERVLVAASLACLLYLLISGFTAYPAPWQMVVAATVFMVTLWSPPVAFFLTIIAALYPLYTLSLYLAVLFLAAALLGQRVFINNMGAALLVIASPWLVQYHLEWLVVVLGALWWGKSGAAWMAGLACLWGQLLFGMTGANPDWLVMMGVPPATAAIAARFGAANSLATLKLLVTPLAPNPTLLLYHLLQVVLWAMAAGLMGGLAESPWMQHKQPWRGIAIAFGGAVCLALGHLALANWLDQYHSNDFAWIFAGLFETALYVALLAALLETLRDFAERPLGVFGRARATERQTVQSAQSVQPHVPLAHRLMTGLWALRKPARTQTAASAMNTEAHQETYQPLPVPPNLPKRDAAKQQPDDIIKIELD